MAGKSKHAKAHSRMTKAELIEELGSLTRRLEAAEGLGEAASSPDGAPGMNMARLHEILESSPIGATIVRDDGSFEFINSRMAEIVGMSKAQLMNVKARDLYYDPSERDAIRDRLKKEDRLRNIEVRMKRPNGEPFWILLSFEKVQDEKHRRFFGWVYDITEFKQAEEELQRNETLLNTVFDTAAVGMVMHAADGSTRVRVNDAFCDFVGYSRKYLLNQPYDKLTHPLDLDESIEFRRQLMTGEIDHFQLEKRY
ncbi:MAG: PAS domain S-box protein, partial [Proteobacteria bacterium]|nr:PAS domain S-box protein [Pseudomonadota bacterium]